MKCYLFLGAMGKDHFRSIICTLLYVYGGRGGHHLRKNWMKIPHLIRNLARDLVGSYRVFIGLLSVAKIETTKNERK